MAKAELILTEEQAIAFGQALQTPLVAIGRTAELSRLHGDTVASLYRVAALKEFRKVVNAEEIKALIIAAAGDGYEVAESGSFKIPDEIKLEGAVRAMQKGYLLSDEAGPHFTVILGKGGVSVLIKEAGHRHKLRRAGCKQIDVISAAKHMRPRPNASGKFDMIVEGRASCVLNGEVITVERLGDLPIILPCYDTDGPDGHEAKARRRLLRDLWAKVSGDFEPIELDEIDSDTQVEQIYAPPKAIERKPAVEIEDMRAIDAKVWEQTKTGLQRRVKDEQQLGSIMAYWDEISNATNKDQLRLLYNDIDKTQVKALGKNNVEELLRFCKWTAEGIIEGSES
jgi:hypothetical protein